VFDEALREGVHEMRRISYAVALLAVSLLLLNAGCYTVLQHPTGSSVVQQGTYYRSCADCHADAAYYHPYSQPYYSSHDRWGGYYGSYWWYDDYYWYDPYYDYDDDYIGPKVETDTRHLWGSSGWASGGWGFTKRGSGSSRAAPPASQPSQKNDKKKTETKEKTKEKEKPKEKEKEKEKDERDLWKQRKKGF
jgi:hypothetical protein